MNPYLSGALILILRWQMFITRQLICRDISITSLKSLTDETTDFCDKLSSYTLNSHGMNDIEVDPNKKVM